MKFQIEDGFIKWGKGEFHEFYDDMKTVWTGIKIRLEAEQTYNPTECRECGHLFKPKGEQGFAATRTYVLHGIVYHSLKVAYLGRICLKCLTVRALVDLILFNLKKIETRGY